MSNDSVDPIAELRLRPTVTVAQAAKALGISLPTAYRWARNGVLPGAMRIGPNAVRVRTATLLAVLEPPSTDR